MSNIFITGGTGFLGAYLIKDLLKSGDDKVFALVRANSRKEAQERLSRSLMAIPGNKIPGKAMSERLKAVPGDICMENLGMDDGTKSRLALAIDMIISNAAVTKLNTAYDEAYSVNVNGTRNVMEYALCCKDKGKLKKVCHVSTAYVAGRNAPAFKESDLDAGQEFNNSYEKTKFEAEKLVREYRLKGLDIDVFRPSIILGSSIDGWTSNFKMFYEPLHIFSKGIYDRIPASADSRPNIINVDIVSKAIIALASRRGDVNATYHIVSPVSPELGHIVSLAADYFGFRMPEFVAPEGFDQARYYSAAQALLIKPFTPYFNYFTRFDMAMTRDAFLKSGFAFPAMDDANMLRLYSYLDKTGFIRRKKHVVTR